MIVSTPIVDLFRSVVLATEAAILPYLKTVDPLIEHLHYEHGHPQEIVNTLISMTQTQEWQMKKYPMVALFQDFGGVTPDTPTGIATVRVNIIICTKAAMDAKASDRYATTFNPILHPIYRELLRQLSITSFFRGTAPVRHEPIDHPFYGKDGLYGTIANMAATDALDCVEMRNTELRLQPARQCVGSFKNF